MNIVVNSIKVIDDAAQIVYFSLTDDEATTYHYHSRTAVLDSEALQTYLEENMEDYLYFILMTKYPGADPNRMSGATKLAKMQAWIAAGCQRLVDTVDGNPVYEIIEEQAFVGTHEGTASSPEYIDRGKISDATRDELANATTIAALRTVLQKILLGS